MVLFRGVQVSVRNVYSNRRYLTVLDKLCIRFWYLFYEGGCDFLSFVFFFRERWNIYVMCYCDTLKCRSSVNLYERSCIHFVTANVKVFAFGNI